MSGEERALVSEMIEACKLAKEKGVTLFLANTQNDTNIYCCSSADGEVVHAMAQPETSNLTAG